MDSPPEPNAREYEERPRGRGRALLFGGAAAALIAGVALAAVLLRGGSPEPAQDPGAAADEPGLQVDLADTPSERLDARKPLRCFVDGRFVGLKTLSECAEMNGVASQGLDVGLDDTGSLAAATDTALDPVPADMMQDLEQTYPEGPAVIVEPQPLPLPPDMAAADAPPVRVPVRPPVRAAARPATGPCWRYAGTSWQKVGDDMTLGSCASALFDGQCVVSPSAALYGRWAEETLRLVPGRLEAGRGQSGPFRRLVEQAPGSCSIPPL